MPKRIFLLFIVGLAFLMNSLWAQPPKKVKILISKTVDHPALNRTAQGIREGLQEAGYQLGDNLELREESAQASPVLAQQIADDFAHKGADIVVAIGTMAAQSFIKYAARKQVQLIFSSVTDPVGAGLDQNLRQSARSNISGVSNFVPLEPQLALFKKLLPRMKRLGVLYNAGEANSKGMVSKLEKICPLQGLILVKQTISKTTDVAQNALRLAQKADAIFVSNDNTALSAFQSVLSAAQKKKIPVFVSDIDVVHLGAVAALGPNQHELGKQTARMMVRILQGQDIAKQPIEFPDQTELYVNGDAAKKAGVFIPEDIIKSAKKVFAPHGDVP